MKKLIFRVLAYGLDLLLVNVIVLGLSMISFINPNSYKVDMAYMEYNEIISEYNDLNEHLDELLEDGKFDVIEKEMINEGYSNYAPVFSNYEVDVNITNKQKSEIQSKLYDRELELYNIYSQDIAKLNVYQSIYLIVLYVIYFGIIQYFLKGQTLFKRLLRIKVVDNKDINKRVPLWKFLVRSILVSEAIILTMNLVFAFVFKTNTFASAMNVTSYISYIYELLFMVMIVLRNDQRGVEDLLLGTRVIRMDKYGKEIEEQVFNDEVEEKPKKEKTKKEKVKAEKVDD